MTAVISAWIQKNTSKIGEFLCSHFNIEDGRNSNPIETLVENNQCYTTREIANILKISTSSAENHLQLFGYANYLDVWVVHKLSKKNPS